MNVRLLWPIWAGIILVLPAGLLAQTILFTKPLSVTSSCPGSTMPVPFSLTFGTYTTNTIFTVQISDGGDFKDIPTGKTLLPDGTTVDERKINATLPSDLVAGAIYLIRVRTTNPEMVGTISPTQLVIRGTNQKPASPVADSIAFTCQSLGEGSNDQLYADIYIRKLDFNMTPRLYTDSTYDSFREDALINEWTLPSTGERQRMADFQVRKQQYNTPTFIYPVAEHTYYVSQINDGCESDKVSVTLRTLWTPKVGPTPANYKPGQGAYQGGKLAYCQGEQAYPLNVNGHENPPENYKVLYYEYTANTNSPTNATLIPPVPDTHIPGQKNYAFGLVPIDATKGCALTTYYDAKTYLTVTVTPAPSKPATTTNVVTYYQGQASVSLSATATDSTATLVWYGTNATGGIGSSEAPKPSTSQVGAVTYYVAQKIGSCESERVPISVLINPALGIEDPTLAELVEIFPNPTVSSLTIRIRGLTGRQSARFELVDLTGQSLLQKETQQETAVLPMTDYPNGSYLLLINVGDRKTTRRILKL